MIIDLKLDKNIAQLLRIFANAHGSGNTEIMRLDDFTAKEMTKIIKSLANWPEGPPQEGFSDSLKQHIENLLNKSKNNENVDSKRDMDDLK